VKNKTYDQTNENISYSKSVDFKKDRKSWPLAQVVECVAFESVSRTSPSESENDINVVDPVTAHNGCVSVFQADDLQLDSINESCLDASKNNVLKIVLPLVSENVPLDCQLQTIEHNQFLEKKNCGVSSNNQVQYLPIHCVDTPVCINKNVNNRNHSLPEDSELNRFSSTFENIKTLLKEGLVDGLDEMPPDFQPPNPPLLYRVSSLPNLLSHDSTKSHHSCSYLTMCATKHELFMNKLCKNIVAKHDMSVQVSTELFKNQNEKILVDTSCQTEDIFLNCQVNDEVLTKKTNCVFDLNINVSNKEHEMEHNEGTDFKNDEIEDSSSIGYTNINMFDKERELGITADQECDSIGYTNINVLNTDREINTVEEEECASFGYSGVNVFNKEHKANANEEDYTSVGYININVFNKDNMRSKREDFCTNVSFTNISTFDKACEIKSSNEGHANIDYTSMNVVDDGNEVVVKEEHSKVGYTGIKMFDKEVKVKTNGEDCVDIGYTNVNLYGKGLEIDSNDDCENYSNANILEEFINEQLSLNNVDGDFDSFLFGPLPPSPIEETGKVFNINNYYCLFNIKFILSDKLCIVSELPVLNGVEAKRENSAPVPFIFDIHKNEPSTSIIKSRSIDAEFSHNFQQHQKIGTRSVCVGI